MAKSKPRKKYNPKKVAYNSVKHHSGQYFIAHSWLQQASYFYDHNGNPARPPITVQKYIKEVPLIWSVACLIIARDKNGKNKLRIMDVGTPRHPDVVDRHGNFLREGDPIPTKYTDLAPGFCKEHLEFIREYQEKAVETYIGYGWVCSPAGLEITEDILYKIMDWLGVWKEKAIWEIDVPDEKTDH